MPSPPKPPLHLALWHFEVPAPPRDPHVKQESNIRTEFSERELEGPPGTPKSNPKLGSPCGEAKPWAYPSHRSSPRPETHSLSVLRCALGPGTWLAKQLITPTIRESGVGVVGEDLVLGFVVASDAKPQADAVSP